MISSVVPQQQQWTTADSLQDSTLISERQLFEQLIVAIQDPDKKKEKWLLRPECDANRTHKLRPLVVRWGDTEKTYKVITYFGYRHVPRNVPEGARMATEDDDDETIVEKDNTQWMDKLEVLCEVHNRHIVIRAPSSQQMFYYAVCENAEETASKFFPRLWQGLLRRYDSPFSLAYANRPGEDHWHIFVRFDPDLLRFRLSDFPIQVQQFEPMILGYSRNVPDRSSDQNIAVRIPLFSRSTKGVWTVVSLQDALLLTQPESIVTPTGESELIIRRNNLLAEATKVQYVDKKHPSEHRTRPRPLVTVHYSHLPSASSDMHAY